MTNFWVGFLVGQLVWAIPSLIIALAFIFVADKGQGEDF